jgi:hypothetical protein
MENTDESAAKKIGLDIGKAVGEGFLRTQLLDTDDIVDTAINALKEPPHVEVNTILIELKDKEHRVNARGAHSIGLLM